MATESMFPEIPQPTAAQKAVAIVKQAAEDAKVAQQQELERNLAMLDGSPSLGWDQLSPKAQIMYLCTKPYAVKRDDGSYAYTRLTFWDAVAMVGLAKEKGLSALSSDIYPIFRQTGGNGVALEYRVINWGTSSEARAKIAAKSGMVFGPPHYEPENDYLRRPWPKDASVTKPAWTDEDLGLTCTMNMYIRGEDGKVTPEPSSYTCWLSQWYAGTGAKNGRAYWDKNPRWMMMVRSKEKNITLASGVGQSELQEDDAPVVQQPIKGDIVATEFKEVKPTK